MEGINKPKGAWNVRKSNAANHTQRFANHHRADTRYLVDDDTLVCRETKINPKSLKKIESGRAAITNMDIGYLLDYYQLNVSVVLENG